MTKVGVVVSKEEQGFDKLSPNGKGVSANA
jgi:hypothetical protein